MRAFYEKLFDHYYQRIAFFCWRYTQDREDGLDIASDVFIKLWDDREKFESATYLRNFLYGSARNACIDYLRKKQHQQNRLQEMVKFPNEEEEDFLILQTEYLDILHEEVALLPDRVRIVFQLSYFEHLTNQQIADKLHISLNSVYVTVRYHCER